MRKKEFKSWLESSSKIKRRIEFSQCKNFVKVLVNVPEEKIPTNIASEELKICFGMHHVFLSKIHQTENISYIWDTLKQAAGK